MMGYRLSGLGQIPAVDWAYRTATEAIQSGNVPAVSNPLFVVTQAPAREGVPTYVMPAITSTMPTAQQASVMPAEVPTWLWAAVGLAAALVVTRVL